MSKDIKLSMDFKQLPQQLGQAGHKIARYIPILFFVIVAGVYGFLLLQIGTYSKAGPDESVVTAQTAGISPNIDKEAIEQIKQLQDNSVNVQSLFDQARSNPFNE